MKIVAISDTHGFLPTIEKADLLLIGGDISPYEIERNMSKMTRWLVDDFATWIKKLPVDKVIMTPGNHDFWFRNFEAHSNILALKLATNMKLEILFNESIIYTIGNEEVSIFGTPYCTTFGMYAYMVEDEILERKFSEIPIGVDILLAHNPPYNMCNVDLLYQNPKQGHIGNNVLTKHIIRTKPKYVICGHLHSGNHNMENIDGINMVNVSMTDEWCEPIYVPFVFNF